MRHFTMNGLVGKRVHQAKPIKRGEDTPKLKRVGKVHQLVFSLDGRRVVGATVSRPDIAGMVKRDDLFVALDALAVCDEGFVIKSIQGATDSAACKRLGIDWSTCIIWGGMDVVTEDGRGLGYVTDVRFNADTGDVAFMGISDGSAAQALVGQIEIPSGLIIGYQGGKMVVDNRATTLKLTGGLAGKAGEAANKLKTSGKEAGKVATEAVDKGAHVLGRQAGRVRNMFSDMKREFDEGRNDAE